ncbi:MAG: hydrolase, partial [Alphaproteobacteria bacterium]|nr:hydrolase [Alphaproteobacteria bacterium]
MTPPDTGSPTRTSGAADIVGRAHSLVPTIAAAAPRIDAARELPADLLAALHDAGLFRLLLPRALNGAELHPVALFEVMEAV